MIRENIKPVVLLLIVFSIITGIVYPVFVTGVAQLCFHRQANGSLIYRNGVPAGSVLIGQSFEDPAYFRGRPSATSPVPFNAASSSGSNLGPSNPVLSNAVNARIQALRTADPDNARPVPVDLVTSSASGLDPHISPAAAYYQVVRVARLRGLPQNTVKDIVKRHTRGRFAGLIGEPVVNVLEVNLDLDAYAANNGAHAQ